MLIVVVIYTLSLAACSISFGGFKKTTEIKIVYPDSEEIIEFSEDDKHVDRVHDEPVLKPKYQKGKILMGYAITKGGDDYFIDFLGRIKNTFFDDVEKLKRLYAVYSNPIEYSTYNYGDYFDEDIGVSMQKFITTYYYGYLAMTYRSNLFYNSDILPYLYQIDVINIPVDINLTFNYVGNYACKVYWLREDSNNDADNLYEYLFESDYTDNESHIYAKFNISNNTLKNHILYYDKLCVMYTQ